MIGGRVAWTLPSRAVIQTKVGLMAYLALAWATLLPPQRRHSRVSDPVCHEHIRDSLRFGHPPRVGCVRPEGGAAAFGAVAQWIERRRPKACVAGSIPASPSARRARFRALSAFPHNDRDLSRRLLLVVGERGHLRGVLVVEATSLRLGGDRRMGAESLRADLDGHVGMRADGVI